MNLTLYFKPAKISAIAFTQTYSNKTFAVAIFFITLLFCSPQSNAENVNLIRIGTGGPTGTYYPIGGLIAQAISDTDGYRICQASECDKNNLPIIAVHQASNGSIANALGIQNGTLEAGLVQSNVAHWAFSGTGVFKDKGSKTHLRAIGSLYTESIHLVARKDANIESIHDLKGKRVSLDEPGSGTLVDATLLLKAYDLTAQDLNVEYIKPGIAKSKLLDDKLDAFFIVGRFPVPTISELAESGEVTLVPIDGPEKSRLIENVKFFSEKTVPQDTYPNIDKTNTLGVGALLLVSEKLQSQTVYQITKKLWSEMTREIPTSGRSIGGEISTENLNKGVSVPFHAGALRFYSELNLPISK